jgi:hypothetical protein
MVTSAVVTENLEDDVASGAQRSDAQAREKSAAKNAPTDDGHLAVSELIADRPAAPSPFGDDQTFPLPVEDLSYKPAIPSN